MTGNSIGRIFVAAAVAAAAAMVAGWRWRDDAPAKEEAAAGPTAPASSTAPPGEPSGIRHPVVVAHPTGPPRIATDKVDALGHAVTLSCASCHANRPPNRMTSRGADLNEFHQSLSFAHGTLKCVSCHHPGDYNSLRLADGESLPFTRVQSLCIQCHAPQARDYEHGAHGGMNGYWDLTRGPRQRKGCIDCHDPHAPAFPNMVRTFRSHDRFLAPQHPGEPHE